MAIRAGVDFAEADQQGGTFTYSRLSTTGSSVPLSSTKTKGVKWSFNASNSSSVYTNSANAIYTASRKCLYLIKYKLT